MEKSSTDGHIILLLGCGRSPFRDFESYLRVVVRLDEHDNQLTLKQYKEKFITYELSPGVYKVRGISEAVYTTVHNYIL